ncbi:hypothetical protein [Actinoplanes sp. NPDC049118]|uniref:hypothetical protein n=1 Tax=Actinoplanes sp. NPDC049118 TaxID=3155769 RepID=UPI0033DE4571
MNQAGTRWILLCGFRVHGPLRRRGEAPEQVLAEEFAARLWQRSTEEDRVQHIRVRVPDPPPTGSPEPGTDPQEFRLDVGILLMAESDDKARAVGARLCSGALASSPDTVGWALQPLF